MQIIVRIGGCAARKHRGNTDRLVFPMWPVGMRANINEFVIQDLHVSNVSNLGPHCVLGTEADAARGNTSEGGIFQNVDWNKNVGPFIFKFDVY